MRFGRQTSKFSEIVRKCQMTVPAVVVLAADISSVQALEHVLRAFTLSRERVG